MEPKYPARKQLEEHLEIAEEIGSARVKQYKQMLAMHDEIDFWKNKALELTGKYENWIE